MAQKAFDFYGTEFPDGTLALALQVYVVYRLKPPWRGTGSNSSSSSFSSSSALGASSPSASESLSSPIRRGPVTCGRPFVGSQQVSERLGPGGPVKTVAYHLKVVPCAVRARCVVPQW
eukprot:3786861-Prymnesium_polylepis.1